MKGKTIIFFTVVLLITITVQLNAQVSSTAANIGIDAKVIAPISISNTGSKHLNFGTVTRSSNSGTVILTADQQRTSTGGVSVLSNSAYSAAPFTATGQNNTYFTIALPTTNVILTKVGGTEPMEVSDFTHNSGLLLSGSGVATFSVGATLNLDANQVSGDYIGSFSVTINYQ